MKLELNLEEKLNGVIQDFKQIIWIKIKTNNQQVTKINQDTQDLEMMKNQWHNQVNLIFPLLQTSLNKKTKKKNLHKFEFQNMKKMHLKINRNKRKIVKQK